jgi:hypothetical protein
MNIDEIGALLAICATFDYRNPGTVDLEAWEAVLGDLTFADAREAVLAYYRANRERIMPADVRRGVSVIRRARVERVRDEDLLPDAHPTLSPAMIARVLQARRALVLNGMSPQDAIRHAFGAKVVDGRARSELN